MYFRTECSDGGEWHLRIFLGLFCRLFTHVRFCLSAGVEELS